MRFVFAATRWPGMTYFDRELEAPDVDAAIAAFLAARGHPPETIAAVRRHPVEGARVPRDCNIVYQVEGDNERLVAAFDIPQGVPAPTHERRLTMRRIIDGLLYDTDTAERLCTEPNTEVSLYRTKNGRYFTAQADGILVMNEREARSFVEHAASVDRYIAIFGSVEEG
jgi:hypothetical protein